LNKLNNNVNNTVKSWYGNKFYYFSDERLANNKRQL